MGTKAAILFFSTYSTDNFTNVAPLIRHFWAPKDPSNTVYDSSDILLQKIIETVAAIFSAGGLKLFLGPAQASPVK